MHTKTKIDVLNGEIQLTLRDSSAQQKYQCKTCHKFGHFTSLSFQTKQDNSKPRRPKAHQLHAGAVYAKESARCHHMEEDTTSEGSFCLQVKIKCTQADKEKVPRSLHLITNVAYRLKPHHTRNLHLRARLDTCVDVNLMPASMYKLVCKDQNMQKLTPNNLEIGTYTTDTVKIVGSCTFYLVYPDTKKLMEVTFYVETNDGRVLLSCKTTLVLGLMQPRTRLHYLLPKESLISSTADHPKKTKLTLHIQRQEVSAQTPKAKKEAPTLITCKDKILCDYPDVFQEIGTFPGPSYCNHLN